MRQRTTFYRIKNVLCKDLVVCVKNRVHPTEVVQGLQGVNRILNMKWNFNTLLITPPRVIKYFHFFLQTMQVNFIETYQVLKTASKLPITHRAFHS